MTIHSLREARRAARLGQIQSGDRSLMEIANTRPHRYPRFAGPGSATEYILFERWGARACGGCLTSRQKMDLNGPQWCREHIGELAQEMHDNVQQLQLTHKGNWIKVGEWFAHATTGLHYHKQLINEGINLYETTSAVSQEDGNK